MPDEDVTLLLVHGLDGNGCVWDGVARAWDQGPVLAPDLAGHGAAPRLGSYTVSAFAGDLAERVGPALAGRDVVAVGHSLGAVVLLTLIGLLPTTTFQRVVVLSTKTSWSQDELAALRRTAESAPRWFDDERSARERFLRVTGLADHLAVDHPAAARGVAAQDGRWRLAVDPATHLVDMPELGPLLAAAPRPLVLGRGVEDVMATQSDMDRFDLEVCALAACGHNPHVERPDLVAALLR